MGIRLCCYLVYSTMVVAPSAILVHTVLVKYKKNLFVGVRFWTSFWTATSQCKLLFARLLKMWKVSLRYAHGQNSPLLLNHLSFLNARAKWQVDPSTESEYQSSNAGYCWWPLKYMGLVKMLWPQIREASYIFLFNYNDSLDQNSNQKSIVTTKIN